MSTFTDVKDGTIVSTEEKQCPYCGMMVVAYANFCTNCGERIGSKKCPQCGKTAEYDAKFCSGCGTRLDGGAAAQPKRDSYQYVNLGLPSSTLWATCNVGASNPEDVQPKGDMHQYVDLGLPSGTLWATCNVGASTPEDYGDYFAWGETDGKKTTYSWSTYKYANGAENKLIKYCNNSAFVDNSFTDSRTILEKSDDTAAANLGSDWRMPTPAQFQELKDKCTWTWTSVNDKKGYEVKGPNGNAIFLPAAGYIGSDGKYSNVGSYGRYWSSSLYTDYPGNARRLDFFSGYVNASGLGYRYIGNSVRPVRCKN